MLQPSFVRILFAVVLSGTVPSSTGGATNPVADGCGNGAGANAFVVPYFNSRGANKNPSVSVLFDTDKSLQITVTDSIENQVLHTITFTSTKGPQSKEFGQIDKPELKSKLYLRKITIAATAQGETYCSWGRGHSSKNLYIWTPGGNWYNIGKREEFSNPQRLADQIEAVVSVVPRE